MHLLRAELYLKQNQAEQALAVIESLEPSDRQHPKAIDCLKQIYFVQQNWYALIELLPQLKRHKVLNAEQLASLEQQVYAAYYAADGEQLSLAELTASFDVAPKAVQKDPAVVLQVAKLCLAQDDHDQAEQYLYHFLKNHWDPQIIKLYGLVASSNVQKQLHHAEHWLKHHQEDAELLLTLGRLSICNQLWGKARSYLEQCIRMQAMPEAFCELARVMEHLGEVSQAQSLFREGMLKAVDVVAINTPS